MAWLCATIWVNFKEIPAIMMCTPMHIYPTTQIGVLFDFEGGGSEILCENPYFFFTF